MTALKSPPVRCITHAHSTIGIGPDVEIEMIVTSGIRDNGTRQTVLFWVDGPGASAGPHRTLPEAVAAALALLPGGEVR